MKQAKGKGEDGKIAIRYIRRKAMVQLKKLLKDGDAGEDEVVFSTVSLGQFHAAIIRSAGW